MLAWSGGELITDVRKPEIMVMTSLWAWSCCQLSDHPLESLSSNPKLKSTGAGRYQLLSVGRDAYRKQLGLKDFSPKSRDAVALQQIKERSALPDWSWWYPSGNRPFAAISGLHCLPGAGYGQFEHKVTAWLQNSKKRAERSERLMWAKSPRLSRSWLSASSSACHGLLIITVITPLPTKPSATKMPENWSWRTQQYWHADASAWCCLRSMQNTRRS